MSAVSLLFFYTKCIRLTIVYFVSITIILSMWALPVYATAIKTRMPSKMGVENCFDPYNYKMLLIFGWLTAFCALAVLAFSICRVLVLAVIPAVLYVAFNLAVVVYWWKLRRDVPRCTFPFWWHESYTLDKLAMPQFAVAAFLAIMVVWAICALCDDGGGGYILVIFHPDGSVTMEDHT